VHRVLRLFITYASSFDAGLSTNELGVLDQLESELPFDKVGKVKSTNLHDSNSSHQSFSMP